MTRLTFEQIVDRGQKKISGTVTYEVPEWEGDVELRGLIKEETNEIRKVCSGDEPGDFDVSKYEKLVFCAGMVDPKIDGDMYDMLLKTMPGPLGQVLDAIFALSGIKRGKLREVARNFPV